MSNSPTKLISSQVLHVERQHDHAADVNPTLFLCIFLSSATIRNAFLLLLVATATWLCGLMAVNNSILAIYYIFNVLCLVQV